ncbi:MAG: hypothetical protein SGARI_001513 [Bacillariaceae sp.]
MVLPPFLLQNLGQHILVTPSALQLDRASQPADDIIMVELAKVPRLPAGKQWLEAKPPTAAVSDTGTGDMSAFAVVAHTAAGLVAASRLEHCKDHGFFTLSSTVLENGDSGSIVLCSNKTIANSGNLDAWGDFGPGTDYYGFGSCFLLGIYLGTVTMGAAQRLLHVAIPVPSEFEKVKITGRGPDNNPVVVLEKRIRHFDWECRGSASFASDDPDWFPKNRAVAVVASIVAIVAAAGYHSVRRR